MSEKEDIKWKRIEEVHYDLDIARDLVPEYAVLPLCNAVAYLPDDIIYWISMNILFIGEDEEGCAWYSFTHWAFKGRKGFVLFSHSLWKKEEIEICITVAHEVAHAFLGHTITIDPSNLDSNLDRRHYEENEVEADKLAIQWLSPYFDKKELRKICNGWKE